MSKKDKALDGYEMPNIVTTSFVGTITYDPDAAPITTYCPECGHETGQEQPHAKECSCMRCRLERRASKWSDTKGKTIMFRTFAPLETAT